MSSQAAFIDRLNLAALARFGSTVAVTHAGVSTEISAIVDFPWIDQSIASLDVRVPEAIAKAITADLEALGITTGDRVLIGVDAYLIIGPIEDVQGISTMNLQRVLAP